MTGAEVSLTIDGARAFGGYVTQVSMGHMAPAADTSNLSTYQLRTWTLRGADYNIIFDKRVWRNTADYLSVITVTDATDGGILRNLVDNYADCSDFDSSGITDIVTMPTPGDKVQQGTTLRPEFTSLSFFGAAAWYIDANKNFIYIPYEDIEKRWGFSDQPNHAAITASPASFQGATTGFRQVEATEDGSFLANDALVWGGSKFAGPAGATVFDRVEDGTSESDHGRWQYSETHFGESLYSSQTQVDLRAEAIVNGLAGTTAKGAEKGLKNTQWQFTFTWFGVDVPLLSGVPDHLVAGDIVTIEMNTFGVTKLLPLRSLRTSFPDALEDDGSHVVQFDGTFGLQLGDPFTLWKYILDNQSRIANTVASAPAAVNDSSTSTVYGAFGQFAPTPATDDVTTLFTLPFGYVSGSLQLYQGTTGGNGAALLASGIDYAETDNVAGTLTLTVPPPPTPFLFSFFPSPPKKRGKKKTPPPFPAPLGTPNPPPRPAPPPSAPVLWPPLPPPPMIPAPPHNPTPDRGPRQPAPRGRVAAPPHPQYPPPDPRGVPRAPTPPQHPPPTHPTGGSVMNYRPTFLREGPPSPCVYHGRDLKWLNCSTLSAAMGMDKSTNGRVRLSGCAVREQTGDWVGGTMLSQMRDVAEAHGIKTELHVGSNVATLWYASYQGALGRGAIVQGNTQPDGRGNVNHAVFVNEPLGGKPGDPTAFDVFDPWSTGPAVWSYAKLKAFAGALHPWGESDPRTLRSMGVNGVYCLIFPAALAEPVHLHYGGARTSPSPDTLTVHSPTAGRRVNVRSRPDRINKADIAGTLATGTKWNAYQQTDTGIALAGSRRWFGNHDGNRWIHSSGVTGVGK